MNKDIINSVLACIKEYQLDTGRSPSYREIMRLCRLPSIGQVQRCVKVLKEQGELDSEADGSIALDDRFLTKHKAVPLVGTIACGSPIDAIENYENVYRLPEELVGRGEHFMLHAKGDSMTGVGIYDGDMLIIRMQSSANKGDIVAAMIDEEDATIKTFRPQGDSITLQAENPNYKDIIVTPNRCRILGVLVGSFRKY